MYLKCWTPVRLEELGQAAETCSKGSWCSLEGGCKWALLRRALGLAWAWRANARLDGRGKTRAVEVVVRPALPLRGVGLEHVAAINPPKTRQNSRKLARDCTPAQH